MAEIELVIKIPEEEYILCKELPGHLGDYKMISSAIANGKPYELCDDAISRQAIVDECVLYARHEHDVQFRELVSERRKFIAEIVEANCCYFMNLAKSLPTVKPKERVGHWILDESDNSITCDKCRCKSMLTIF